MNPGASFYVLARYDQADLNKGQLDGNRGVADIWTLIHPETTSYWDSVILVSFSAPAQRCERDHHLGSTFIVRQKPELADASMKIKAKINTRTLQLDARLLTRVKTDSTIQGRCKDRRCIVTGDLITDFFTWACYNPLISSYHEQNETRIQKIISDWCRIVKIQFDLYLHRAFIFDISVMQPRTEAYAHQDQFRYKSLASRTVMNLIENSSEFVKILMERCSLMP